LPKTRVDVARIVVLEINKLSYKGGSVSFANLLYRTLYKEYLVPFFGSKQFADAIHRAYFEMKRCSDNATISQN